MAHIKPLTTDEILKLKAVALYIVDKCESIDYFHLFKILYFADREHYARYGRRIVNDTFCALKNGPVPSNLYDVVKDVNGAERLLPSSPLKVISLAFCVPDSTYPYIISANERPDCDELSKSDMEMLDKSIESNKDVPFRKLSDLSHDGAWTDAHNRQPNSEMDPLMMAKAAGASDDTMAYLRDEADIDGMLR